MATSNTSGAAIRHSPATIRRKLSASIVLDISASFFEGDQLALYSTL
ncbi:MAG TPA: hypothetical protein VFJ72_11830 [Rubrobacteraceae bacterium]|nr:hypothetical protein [Rubrobacteraceae bacterium]